MAYDNLNANLGGTLTFGVPGASAYEVAVKNGFKGTEAEWLASLQGYTPQKGQDYFTDTDKQEMTTDVLERVRTEGTEPEMEGTEAADKCADFAYLLNGKDKTEAFVFFTDPHLVHKSGYETEMRKYLQELKRCFEMTPASFVLCGGDWIGNSDTQREVCFKLGYIDSYMRKHFPDYFPVVGNHDTNYQGVEKEGAAANSGTLTNETIRNLMMPREDKTYYSFRGINTRFYVLDTGTDWDDSMFAYRWEQVDWLGNQLRSNDDEHIAIILHIGVFLHNGGYIANSFTNNVFSLCEAFNNKSSITLNGVTYDFLASSGQVLFGLCGHIHTDYQAEVKGVPLIATTHMQDGAVPTFDLCLADYDGGVLHMVRIGTGENRSVQIGGIPSGYRQVSYIQSDGSQYIDTGVTGGSNAEYEITFNMLGATAVKYEQYFVGSGENTCPKIFHLNGDVQVIVQQSNDNYEGYWRTQINDNAVHTIRYDGENVKLYVDDVECTTYGYNTTAKYAGCGWGDTSWWVFNSPIEPNLGASMQLYGLKMYSGGNLIRNFVPVVREEDAVAGLYDLVTRIFYQNAGTGTFTVPEE